ncbi:MAG: thioredoxin [Ruminococcus sp.]|jgi:thioredoxin 1|uniref:thioredoxin n=1 Tax=unclassified Ruminococcus TaxID=2608920 RepID=UPI00164AB45F|nr:thioredoxin [uncultured Ruminococcus sp.]MBQ1354500.1 thioredoxin [Ruminococcus sp.]MDO4892687.1 thioredoxin [Eubacteriales bacterium]MBQ1585889.1 thioredoxin [Ruminococcus sp.]MBQ1594427.1 thioredoxin [Ruminococcus sp.]MBQ1830176.1 thioredoxin [Ruminococcus sp.]
MAVLEVTGASFEKEVLQSDRPVLADFYADWCGPCKMLRPILEEISDDRQDVKVVSINIDEEDELAEQFDVSAIPCVVLIKDGMEVDRSVGLKPREALEELL